MRRSYWLSCSLTQDSISLPNRHLLLHLSSHDLTAFLQGVWLICLPVSLPEQNGLWRNCVSDTPLLMDRFCGGDRHGHAADRSNCDWSVHVAEWMHCGSPSGLTAHFKGTVSGAIDVLLDCCCSDTLMAASSARRMGLTVTPVGRPLKTGGDKWYESCCVLSGWGLIDECPRSNSSQEMHQLCLPHAPFG